MQGPTSAKHWAIVLAGGDGTRLQELTRALTGAPIPKQYCRLIGDRSMLEATLTRTQYCAPLERTLVVVNENHLSVAREHLVDVPPGNVLVQPCNRDTGPGLLFALLALAERDPAALVSVFPSDHYVGDDRAFISHVNHAAEVVTQLPDKIVLLGIRPDRPDCGYGYIVPAEPLRSIARNGSAFHVACFYEKPPLEIAQDLLHRGGLWNSFVMVFQVGHMLALLRRTMSHDFHRLSHARAYPSDGYARLQAWNFSSDFLVRIPEHLLVLPVADVHWSDWGTRDAIERTLRRLTQSIPWEVPLPAKGARLAASA